MIIPDKLETFLLYKVPQIPSRLQILRRLRTDNIKLTISRSMQAWYEHDAIHFLGNLPFTLEGEQKVAFLERSIDRGWGSIDKKYNLYVPKKCKYPLVTPQNVDDTVIKIKKILEEL